MGLSKRYDGHASKKASNPAFGTTWNIASTYYELSARIVSNPGLFLIVSCRARRPNPSHSGSATPSVQMDLMLRSRQNAVALVALAYLRADHVKEDIKNIAKALQETADNRPGDVNSILQLLRVESPATVPGKIELSDAESVILKAIKDVGDRVTLDIGYRLTAIEHDVVKLRHAGLERYVKRSALDIWEDYCSHLFKAEPVSGSSESDKSAWESLGPCADKDKSR